ncbi:MAG: PLP-dependent aminotransferase family protein, partial [Acidobacteriota bacterium]|nr:PLP-dependent aminotransferase family protein [Acidobacteriota bacterium]
IESGRLPAGARLPATRELAGQLGLNRTTVSAAYELLDSEGWISGEVGRGSFVRARAGSAATRDWSDLLRPSSAPRQPAFPGVPLSFAQSRPSEALFPLEAFRQSSEAVLRSAELPAILQLGSPAGYEPLRRYLLESARSEGNAMPDDDLLITNGCQQAMDLLRQVLINPGDSVALEDPVYPGVRNLFAQSGAVVTGIPIASQMLDIASLDRARPRVAVVTPSFQNPTGSTLTLSAREALLRIPGTIFIENDIYSSLRYTGRPEPTMKQLDRSGGVVLLRSFSKIAFPGLRVGWVIAPRSLIQRLTEAKQLTDLHTDQFSQAVLLDFDRSGNLAAHRNKMLAAGARRLQTAVEALSRYLPRGSQFTRPEGGMNLWVELPEPLDTAELLPRAQAEGVAYLPGKYFSVTRPHTGALRLSFAGLAEEQIDRGIRILGTLFTQALETERSRDREPVPAMV